MVAAWMNALTGVGPAMASGSQTNSGICADFPAAPMNSSKVIKVIFAGLIGFTCFADSTKSKVQMPGRPNSVSKTKIPRMKPQSPMRLTMNALLPAMVLL